MITLHAPAKLNLALHVTGQRADGYHLLDSLVVFAAAGDRVTLEPGPLSLALRGPFAGQLSTTDNLCLDAARMMGADAAITLTKSLPVASGIGGGSADAAAVMHGLHRMGHALPENPEKLGADVAVCLRRQPARMRGIGEVLDDVPPMPDLALVLVNPGRAVATPQIFAALQDKANPPLPPIPQNWNRAELLDWLKTCRNDLEPPATALIPEIDQTLRALRDEGAELARMSGSGATCFGIFPDRRAAGLAAYRIGAAQPGWWITATTLAPPENSL